MPKTLGRCCLVTGGAGFLGSHLCERLLDLDYEVLCVDNFYTGTKQNIQQLLSHPGFELLRHDMSQRTTLARIDAVELGHIAASSQRQPVLCAARARPTNRREDVRATPSQLHHTEGLSVRAAGRRPDHARQHYCAEPRSPNAPYGRHRERESRELRLESAP